MDAPLYPPSAAYEAPRMVPQPLSIRTTSITELQADPEAVAVLKVLMPSSAEPREGPIAILIEPLSLQAAAAFGGTKQELLDRIQLEFDKVNAKRGFSR